MTTLGEGIEDICARLNALRDELPEGLRHLMPRADPAAMKGDLARYGLDRLPPDLDPRRWNEEGQ